MLAFFAKDQHFLAKVITLLKVIVFLGLFSVFVREEVVVNEIVSFIDHASGIQLLDDCKLTINWKKYNDVNICWHDVIIFFFYVNVFFLSRLVTGLGFMSISLLVLELWQFTTTKDWPEIWKSEIHPSEICLIFGDWSKLGILNLARISLIKCYRILQSTSITSFTIFEVFKAG